LVIEWISSGWVFWSLAVAWDKVWPSDVWFSGLAWLVAFSISPLSRQSIRSASLQWKLLVTVWVTAGVLLSVASGYAWDRLVAFYVGLGGAIALGLIVLLWFRFPMILKQLTLTGILMILGLPLVDCVRGLSPRIERERESIEKFHSYEAARKDPEAYMEWHAYATRQWMAFEKVGLIRKRVGMLPYRLRPNTRAKLYKSDVVINSLGFRGKEFSPHKTNTYRIVTLGESTTFGVTVTPEHHPWPEILEQLIQNRLNPPKPVEVINAGVPGRTLPQNLYRLREEIVNYEPDMLISYHGYNGFFLLDAAIPSASGPPPPAYQPRPSKLLADVEYHIRLSSYRRSRMGGLNSYKPSFAEPLQSRYADEYRELIRICNEHRIQLVLANYSMAVRPDSDPGVIEFYRGGFPSVYTQIRANVAHSMVLEQLASKHPDVCFVDTHPGLDGEHTNFIDLVHFDKSGEQKMAEAFFAKISPLIERDLKPVSP
jgi:lysophospholipase L1-like esterase